MGFHRALACTISMHKARKKPDPGKPVSRKSSQEEPKVLSKARFDRHKTTDPFATKNQAKTAFARAYIAGEIPCRINHGGVRHTLQWDVDPQEISYDPLLITFFEGLTETEHPYVFVVRAGIPQLLMSEDGGEKAAPLVSRLIPLVRQALRSKDRETFSAGLASLCQLSDAVGDVIDEYVDSLLIQIGKYANDRKFSERITETLQVLETNGAPCILTAIKKKVPTYQSVN